VIYQGDPQEQYDETCDGCKRDATKCICPVCSTCGVQGRSQVLQPRPLRDMRGAEDQHRAARTHVRGGSVPREGVPKMSSQERLARVNDEGQPKTAEEKVAVLVDYVLHDDCKCYQLRKECWRCRVLRTCGALPPGEGWGGS
jgi:hypothetical protein